MKRHARSLKLIQLTAFAFVLAPHASAAPKYIPVIGSYFSIGQHHFEGKRSGLGGNTSLTFVPALQFSNRFSVIPTIETAYRAVRSAEELANGSKLFQDTWENGVGVKAVHGLNEHWKLKERIGYRTKWFRETSDESWTKGLYDYRIYNIGTEIERTWKKNVSAALGYDFSYLQFPNYVSLESTQSNDRARELAGDNVLDNRIHLLSLRIVNPFFFRIVNQFQAIYSPRYYVDQNVVNITGLLTAEKRKDTYTGGTLALERVFRTSRKTNLIANLRYGYTRFRSNQNHYDAQATAFLENYYDYNQHVVGPQLTFAFAPQKAGTMLLETGYSYSKRGYTDRVVQFLDGTYGTDKLRITETAFNLAYSYPLAKNFRLRISSSFGRSRSNNQFEQLYRYNYKNSNYQFGFTYDY